MTACRASSIAVGGRVGYTLVRGWYSLVDVFVSSPRLPREHHHTLEVPFPLQWCPQVCSLSPDVAVLVFV